MDLYFTTTNYSPSNNYTFLKYVGTSLENAIQCVSTFQKYEKTPPTVNPNAYSSIPENIERDFVKLYEADGFWCSIVKVSFNDPSSVFHRTVVTSTDVTCECGFYKKTLTGADAHRLAYLHVRNNNPGVIVDKRLCSENCINGDGKPENAPNTWHHITCFHYK